MWYLIVSIPDLCTITYFCHLFEFNFSPEMYLKLSNISTRVSKDFSEPSRIKDASLAKIDFLNSYFA